MEGEFIDLLVKYEALWYDDASQFPEVILESLSNEELHNWTTNISERQNFPTVAVACAIIDFVDMHYDESLEAVVFLDDYVAKLKSGDQ